MEKQKNPGQLNKEMPDSQLSSENLGENKVLKVNSPTKRWIALLALGLVGVVYLGVIWPKVFNPKMALSDKSNSNMATGSSQLGSSSTSSFEEMVVAYNEAVQNYNIVAEEYERIKEITSLENIDGLPEVEETIPFLDENATPKNTIEQDIEEIIEKTNELLVALILAQQITNPDEGWVIERLKSVDDIMVVQAVTENHDPNHLLNVDGGYTSCAYFSVRGIRQSSIKGEDIVEKGTDAGGAIEIYKTVIDAKNRCEYLGQFDNTLLYSGSYAIVGTTVIRTSYLLSNEKQIELTKKITAAFTALR